MSPGTLLQWRAIESAKRIPGHIGLQLPKGGRLSLAGGTSSAQGTMPTAPGAYLEITLQIDDANRGAAAAVYTKYKQPFLNTIDGAMTKTLLVRPEDVQVLHDFDTVSHAQGYLKSGLFKDDVVAALSPFLKSDPDVRIYTAH